jgi:HSP20 family protein
MPIIRYHPYNELDRLHKEMHKLFEDVLGDETRETRSSPSWYPIVDIIEKRDIFIITADIPGLNKEDINLRIDNKILTISGERKFDRDEKKDNFHIIEKLYGKFSRAFRLPNTVSDEGIKAEYKNGELIITLKKCEETKPKRIPISVK